MRKSRISAAAAGAVALATALSACGSSSSSAAGGSSSFNAGLTSVVNPSSHQGGTLRLGMTSDWDSPDPGNTYYSFSWDFMRLYGRSLLTWKQAPGGAGLTLVPDLATDLGTVSKDGLTWTFTIRSGVTYQDGTPVTADDVKYAIERSNWGQDILSNGPNYFKQVIQDKSNYEGPYKDRKASDGVSGIEADGNTIKFHLNEKFADFRQLAALPSTVPVPRAKDTGANYYQHIMSTGQYEISDYSPGKSMTLVPNPKFDSATDPDGIHKVTASKITVQLDMSGDQLDQDLLHGHLDADLDGTGVGTTAQSQILASPTLKAQADDGYTNSLTYMTINTQVKPFDNLDCRKAVEYAIDKTAVQSAYGGALGGGDIASTLLTPDMSGYEPSSTYVTPGNQGDPTTAQTELHACRQTEPSAFNSDGSLDINLSYRTDRLKEANAAGAIQASLKTAGINVHLDGFSGDKYFGEYAGNDAYVKAHSIGLSMMKWGADWPDGYGDLDQLLTADGMHTGGGSSNLGDYHTAAVKALFDKALATTDDTQRAKIWAQIDQQAMKDAAIVPLLYNKALIYHPSNVTNWYMQPAFGMPDFSVLGTTSTD